MNINLAELYFNSNCCLIPLGVPCLKMSTVHIRQLCFINILVILVLNFININESPTNISMNPEIIFKQFSKIISNVDVGHMPVVAALFCE